MHVLVVDDDRNILSTVADLLELKGFAADCAQSGKHALELITVHHYDVIILDVMMPGLDGLETCRQMRARGCTTPILLLTARDTLDDKVSGFESGADDYLVKPFALPELLCRVQALGKRVSRQGLSTLSFGGLMMDLEQRRASRDGIPLRLNQAQFNLLRLLMVQAPKVVTREQLEHELWQGSPPDSDALRSHLYQLRSVLDRGFEHAMLETLRGQGYRLTLPAASCPAEHTFTKQAFESSDEP